METTNSKGNIHTHTRNAASSGKIACICMNVKISKSKSAVENGKFRPVIKEKRDGVVTTTNEI